MRRGSTVVGRGRGRYGPTLPPARRPPRLLASTAVQAACAMLEPPGRRVLVEVAEGLENKRLAENRVETSSEHPNVSEKPPQNTTLNA